MRTRPSILSVTSRYLIRECMVVLTPVVLAFVLIYLIVDFFDRFDILLRSHAAPLAAVRYFLFKIPLMLTQIMPAAVLAAMLLSLGLLSRRNELVALRASGVSLLETAFPLVVLAATISVGTLVWNETIVPYCTRASQYINNVEIRKRPQRGILSERGIWYHGAEGFYSIDEIDPRRGMLRRLTIYQVSPDFELRRVIEVASARWTGHGWISSDAVEHTLGDDGQVHTRTLNPDEPIITESLGDFLEVRRDPDELSYGDLRQRMRELARKGIDPSGYLVDLNMKLAVPFAALVLACVAIPLAGRVVRHPSVAATVGVGLVVGFGYWVLLAFANALGQSGVLPAVVSAWAANVIYILLGCGLFLSLE